MTLRAASPARLNPWLFVKQYPKVPFGLVVLLRGPAPQPGWDPLQCVLVLSYSGPSISVRRRRGACAAAVKVDSSPSPHVAHSYATAGPGAVRLMLKCAAGLRLCAGLH